MVVLIGDVRIATHKKTSPFPGAGDGGPASATCAELHEHSFVAGSANHRSMRERQLVLLLAALMCCVSLVAAASGLFSRKERPL